jgi:hypothetical protein
MQPGCTPGAHVARVVAAFAAGFRYDSTMTWGAIDELKKRRSRESPLRMLVEVAAYGFAISKVWPKVKDHRVEAVRWLDARSLQFPVNLDKISLVRRRGDRILVSFSWVVV